ncbi:phage tail protein [Streptomyces sp. NPDC051320]|uniref:phage tail protein n=1 Tax=Streptomyces sp. NPDC051320 TaxID=3154644 RepID=UPI0034375200
MPIITSTAPVAPPVFIPEVGYATITYWDPVGTPWPMTDHSAARGYYVLADGVSGLGAAPYELTTDPYPRGGAKLRHAQPQPRNIVWPLHIGGKDHNEFVSRWRALAKAFTRTLRDGPGTLDIALPDGSRRQINVLYQEGFDGLGTFGSGITWDNAVITLFCEDPYWVDPVAQAVHREYGVGEDFLQPYPSVSSGQVLGATTVTNPGDIIVWPTWVISGPASLVTFTRTDTGEAFVLDPNATPIGHGALLAGEQVTVTTDPPTVRYQDGSNWVGALDWPDAVLWGLAPGDNAVTFQLDGSGPGSAVDLSYNPRYETP